MRKLVYVALAAMFMVSVSNVFANESSTMVNASPADTTQTDTVKTDTAKQSLSLHSDTTSTPADTTSTPADTTVAK